ncbi:MAG TPA: alpha/beta fold hydrolase [Candidatus Eisenbacteria bacterium]|jgi:predicted alpha/beta-fold hydrolase|nr:alpha/beta fold hydrolase [Candidatus Eisenbacteria bacterium]
MPIVGASTYHPPRFLSNGHLQTMFSALFRKMDGVAYRRERINTPDDDFLDLDWSETGSRRIAVIAHGLEGNSQRSYTRGMVKALANRGWDAVAWNARGCSGEPNHSLRFTHSGATEDLQTVLAHIFSTRDHMEVALIGFSLGGNLTLKYAGERAGTLDPRIKKIVAFSVPCDLRSSSLELAKPANWFYMRHFLAALHKKIRAKMETLPGQIDDRGYGRLRNFKDFDDRYTAPLHGFADAEDYWAKCSCKPFLRSIRIPALLVNARNDPFLAEPCFPVDEAEANPNLHLEMPGSGGHVGFISFDGQGEYWSETRTVSFLG